MLLEESCVHEYTNTNTNTNTADLKTENIKETIETKETIDLGSVQISYPTVVINYASLLLPIFVLGIVLGGILIGIVANIKK